MVDHRPTGARSTATQHSRPMDDDWTAVEVDELRTVRSDIVLLRSELELDPARACELGLGQRRKRTSAQEQGQRLAMAAWQHQIIRNGLGFDEARRAPPAAV